MSAIIKTLKTTTNDVEQSVYPKTVLEAVVDAETNETLDVILDNLNEKIDNIEPGGGGEIPTDVQEQLDGKVSKSGDTMTGTLNANAGLNVSSPNYPPMTVTRSGQPYSAAIRFANSNGTLGAIGMSDTGDELLRWSPDEQTIHTVLDTGNYSDYAVPKTGGTFSGGVTFDSGVNVKGGFTSSSESTIFPQDYYCFQCNDGAGKEGYWKLCTINVTGTYADAPILFYMTSRGYAGKVAIRFNAGSDVSATSLYSLSRESGINSCYVIKTSGTSSGSVFDVYVKKEVPWGNLTVNHLEFPKYMRDLVTLTWSGAYVASLPSGTTEATAYTVLNTTNYSSIPSATQSAVGLMSASDKKKLDGIATGANAYSLPTASSSTLGGVKTTSTVTSNSGYTACPIISGVPYYKDTNTTYSAATTSANGLMTSAMVTKLNGIATGATKVTVDSAMSSSSTNPVQNKIIQAQLPTSNKNASSGYIRFPSAKIQIAWIKKSVTTSISTAWGKMYESASAVDIGSWSAAFSAVPVVSYDAYVSSGACDLSVNKFEGPTATTAGSVYLARGDVLTGGARTFVVTAFAVGTYA